MRRPRRKAEETKDDIIAAAEALLRDKGMSNFSIAHVASALHMSPANVFKHFHTKAALADAICDRHILQMIGRCEAMEEPAPAPQRLAIMVRKLMEAHLADIRENPFLFEMLVVMSDGNLPSGLHYKQLIEKQFSEVIRHGIESGVYKCAADDATSSTVSHAFASVLHPVFLLRADEAELRERCTRLAELVNAALQTPLAK